MISRKCIKIVTLSCLLFPYLLVVAEARDPRLPYLELLAVFIFCNRKMIIISFKNSSFFNFALRSQPCLGAYKDQRSLMINGYRTKNGLVVSTCVLQK